MESIDLKKTTSEKAIQKTIAVLKKKGLVIYPTETCYGIGVDAESQKAVDKLLLYKTRREGKPLSVAVADQKMAAQYVVINRTAQNLYDNFLPGPLTVVSKSKGRVISGVESERKTLGIRIPQYPFVLKLIQDFGRGITATSANVSYAKRPYSFDEWQKYTPQKNQVLVDLFLDAGKLALNPPSTVVDTTLEDYQVLRQGGIKLKINNKKENIKITQSAKETQLLGQKLIEKARLKYPGKCLIFSLQGELGSGKTQFAKGIAKGLGITQNVLSPTFVIVREYRFDRGMFFHLDTWRIFEEEELSNLGFEDMIKPGNVIAIEWGEKAVGFIEKLLQKEEVKIISVNLENKGGDKRVITIALKQVEPVFDLLVSVVCQFLIEINCTGFDKFLQQADGKSGNI